jgi:rod shape-determining protein MreC
MYRLIKLFNDFKDYFVFVVLLIISLSLISVSSTPEIGGFRALVIGGVGYIQNLFSWIPNTGALKNENQALIDLNLQLSTDVAMMRKALQENEELRSMLDLKANSQFKLIAADVIRKNTIQMRNFVTINKGANENIKIGMSVCSEAGLVGNIIGVSKNFSIVELLNNRNVKVPAILSKSELEGIISWEGGDYLYLNNISNSTEVEIGEVVSTSTFSSKYMENLPIGIVTKITDEPGSHFKRISIKPASKFFSFSQLFVINYIPNQEELNLLKEVENKISILEKKGK